MTKFLLAYYGGNAPASKEEGEKVMAAWGQWIGGLGSALTDPGNPTGTSKTVAPDGKISDSGAKAVRGYSILEAGSLDEALSLVKNCPQLAAGGTVEVAEIVPVM